MHAITMLYRLLSTSCPHIHKKRLDCLCAVTGAIVSGSVLTWSDLGRGLASRVNMKHNIKRVDRLLGNEAQHQDLPQRYQALAQKHLSHRKNPALRSHHSRKNARRQRKPWLLAVSPGLENPSANAAVNVDAKRMQIEEEFRDLKNEHIGRGFSANRSQYGGRLVVLLLTACLASFLLRLIGELARAHHMERQYQSNTCRSRSPVRRQSGTTTRRQRTDRLPLL